MSLSIKTRRGNDYLVFTGGRGNELHLGPVNDISKINSDRVLEALDYVRGRYSHYTKIESKLISFLPPEKKEQYLIHRFDEKEDEFEKALKQLSLTGQKEYLQRRIAKLETSLQEIIQKILEIQHAKQTVPPLLPSATAAASPSTQQMTKEKRKKKRKKKKE